jgi:hypothetical protein
MSLASCAGSRGRLGRFIGTSVMPGSVGACARASSPVNFKRPHYPTGSHFDGFRIVAFKTATRCAWSRNGRDWATEFVCLYACDLLFLAAQDVRGVELIGRRRLLQNALRKAGEALRFSEHLEAVDGPAMYRQACAMGLEGLVSKRVDSRYRYGPVPVMGEGAQSGL